MKKKFLVLWGLAITILLSITHGFAGYLITPFTNAGSNPDINNNGQVAWEAIGEIFLYDGNVINHLTDNDIFDGSPQINNNGQVVWYWSNIRNFFYDSTTTTQITNVDSFRGGYPQINNNGYVVWYESDGHDQEIFLYDGSNKIQKTDNEYGDAFPDINDIGQIVWSGHDGPSVVDQGNYI